MGGGCQICFAQTFDVTDDVAGPLCTYPLHKAERVGVVGSGQKSDSSLIPNGDKRELQIMG